MSSIILHNDLQFRLHYIYILYSMSNPVLTLSNLALGTFFSCPFWPFSSFLAASAAYQSCIAKKKNSKNQHVLATIRLHILAHPCLCQPDVHLIPGHGAVRDNGRSVGQTWRCQFRQVAAVSSKFSCDANFLIPASVNCWPGCEDNEASIADKRNPPINSKILHLAAFDPRDSLRQHLNK